MSPSIPSALRVLAISFAIACGGTSPATQLKTAQDALSAQDFDKAVDASAKGLAARQSDPATTWRLELIGLEAQARKGDKVAAMATIERLATDYAAQVKGSLYVSTADQLRAGGDNPGAIELLDAGLKRFPGNADITKAIEQAKQSGGTDELEALKSLGYIGDD